MDQQGRRDQREQSGGAQEPRDAGAGARDGERDALGRQRDDDRGERAEQHAQARDRRAVATVGADARAPRGIRNIDQRVERAKGELRDQQRRRERHALERRREIEQRERQPQRYRAIADHPRISAPPALGPDSGQQIGDTVPHRTDHVDHAGDLWREMQHVGIIEEQEQAGALPIEIAGEVARGKTQPRGPGKLRCGRLRIGHPDRDSTALPIHPHFT